MILPAFRWLVPLFATVGDAVPWEMGTLGVLSISEWEASAI